MFFALLGLGTGALIAGIALSLVLNYQGSGVINLATGAIAMMGAYEFYALRTSGSLFIPLPAVPLVHLGGPWGTLPALVVALLVCAAIGVAFDVVAVSRLRAAPPLAKLVVSLGLLLTLQAIAILRFGPGGQSAPAVLPAGASDVVRVFGLGVPLDRFLLTGIVVLASVALAALYKLTRFGLATRAAAENETSAELAGLAPQWISTANTVIAFMLAGALGILVAPTSQLDPNTIPLAVIPALGAALLARFTSFSIAAAAGIAMGIIQSEFLYLQTQSWFPSNNGIPLPGVADLSYFLIIAAVLLLRGRSLPTRGTLLEPRLPAAPSARRIVAPSLAAAVLCSVAILTVSFNVRGSLIDTLIGALICLSLVVITGFIGQVSLFQIGVAGIAGVAVSKLAVEAGIGFPVGPAIAILIATAVGVAVGSPAFRVRGVNLAILTVAGMVAIENFVFENTSWGAGTGGGAPVPTPKLFGIDVGPSGGFPGFHGGAPTPTFAFICLATLVVLGMLVASVRSGPIGQRMLAVRSNERAAAAAGINPRNMKLIALALSSFIAAIAGVLYAYNFASVTPTEFGTSIALEFVAFTYIGGITTVRGAIIGASRPGCARFPRDEQTRHLVGLADAGRWSRTHDRGGLRPGRRCADTASRAAAGRVLQLPRRARQPPDLADGVMQGMLASSTR